MTDPLDVARRIVDELINRGELSSFDELVADDYRDADGDDRIAYREQIMRMRETLPDLRMTIEHEIVSGEYVVLRLRWNATHTGEFLGVAATGRPIQTTAIGILRIVDGKLVERWNETDLLNVMEQLTAR